LSTFTNRWRRGKSDIVHRTLTISSHGESNCLLWSEWSRGGSSEPLLSSFPPIVANSFRLQDSRYSILPLELEFETLPEFLGRCWGRFSEEGLVQNNRSNPLQRPLISTCHQWLCDYLHVWSYVPFLGQTLLSRMFLVLLVLEEPHFSIPRMLNDILTQHIVHL
jgi:hypothetical protein